MRDTDRYTCTKDNPWSKEISNSAIHPDAVYLRTREDFFDGDEDDIYECPNCKLTFSVYRGR